MPAVLVHRRLRRPPGTTRRTAGCAAVANSTHGTSEHGDELATGQVWPLGRIFRGTAVGLIRGGSAATGCEVPDGVGVANAAAAMPITAADTNTASTTDIRRTVELWVK